MIVPLEFHRGQAERCLRERGQNQIYPHSLYELMVVAPDDFPRHQLEHLRSLLTVRDRLLFRPERHDMALIVKGAEVTTGEILFFANLRPAIDFAMLHLSWSGCQLRPDDAGSVTGAVAFLRQSVARLPRARARRSCRS